MKYQIIADLNNEQLAWLVKQAAANNVAIEVTPVATTPQPAAVKTTTKQKIDELFERVIQLEAAVADRRVGERPFEITACLNIAIQKVAEKKNVPTSQIMEHCRTYGISTLKQALISRTIPAEWKTIIEESI